MWVNLDTFVTVSRVKQRLWLDIGTYRRRPTLCRCVGRIRGLLPLLLVLLVLVVVLLLGPVSPPARPAAALGGDNGPTLLTPEPHSRAAEAHENSALHGTTGAATGRPDA